ncbi:MAG: HD domain-containing protein [Clostridia bacterium]|nr:HD domain-containing protein [Clostridia bacterium]
MLSQKDVLNSKEIYLSKHDELLIPIENRNVGYRFTKQSLTWELTKIYYSWKAHCKSLSGEEALKVMKKWNEDKNKEGQLLNEAIEFATKKHSGQVRKATTIPYILHPLEVLQILYSMRADTNLMIAGVLHDTVEDTNTTLDEIRCIFGDDVANLVASNSEDKSKSWDERKQHTITELPKADNRIKMLIMADKLSNLRSIAYDYNNIGDKLWKRFNAPKEKQSWYYDGIADGLYDMQFIPECENLYWEFTGLFKDIFVKYYLDDSNRVIYQVHNNTDVFRLQKGNPQWVDVSSPPRLFSYDILNNLTSVKRKEAELLEDIWNKPFWDCHSVDLNDMEFSLYSSQKRSVYVIIRNSTLTLCCEDFGKECESINGTDEYEFCYILNEEATHRFLAQLRIKYGIDSCLKDILKQEFGKNNGPQKFVEFCKMSDIPTQFCSK